MINWYQREFGFGSADRVIVISAFGFDLTQKNFFGALTSGAALVLPEGGDFDPDTILDAIEKHGATIVNCAPSAFYSLLDEPARGFSAAGDAAPRLPRRRTDPRQPAGRMDVQPVLSG